MGTPWDSFENLVEHQIQKNENSLETNVGIVPKNKLELAPT
jgi:hypothetical protein